MGSGTEPVESAESPAVFVITRSHRDSSSPKTTDDKTTEDSLSPALTLSSDEDDPDQGNMEDSDSEYEYQSEGEDAKDARRSSQAKTRSTSVLPVPQTKPSFELQSNVMTTPLNIAKIKEMTTKPELSKETYWNTIIGEWDKNRESQKKLRAERKKLKELKSGRIERLKKELEKQKRRTQEQRDRVSVLKKKVEATEIQVKRSNERNLDNEVKLREMQSENERLLAKTNDPVTTDSEVRAQLSQLLQASRKWAYDWSKQNWDETSEDTVNRIADAGQNDAMKDFASPTAREAIRNRKIAPKILLNALVNRILCAYSFVHIFSFTTTDDGKSYTGDSGDPLAWVVKMKKLGKSFSTVNSAL
jgi:hypothetical protein